MEDFSIGSIFSGIVASVIFSLCCYLFIKKKHEKKQSINTEDTEIHGDVEQDIVSNNLHEKSVQSIELKRTTILGDIKQSHKKKH